MNPRADSVVDSLMGMIDYQDEPEEATVQDPVFHSQSPSKSSFKENFDSQNISSSINDSKTSGKEDGSDPKSDSDALLYVSNEIFDKMISNASIREENGDVYLSCQEVETQDGRMLMMTSTEKEDSPKKEFQSPLEACLDYGNLTSASQAILEPSLDLIEQTSEVLLDSGNQGISSEGVEAFDNVFDPSANVCSMCGEKFDDIASYRVHYNNKHSSTGIPSLHCSECKKDFKKAKEYVQHKAKLHPDSSNVCIICGEFSATSRSLQIHLQGHMKKEAFICNTCGRTFSSHESRQDHIRNKHLRPKNTAFQCKHCGAHFQHGRSLVRHVNCVHAKQRVVCQTCNKSYSSISSLYYHQRTVHEKVAFHCGYCSKAFRSVSAIKKHENEMHSDPGKFRDTPTEKTYNYNQYVTYHLDKLRKKDNPTLHIRCMFCKAEYYDHEAYAKHYNKFHSEENKEISVGGPSDAPIIIPAAYNRDGEKRNIAKDLNYSLNQVDVLE